MISSFAMLACLVLGPGWVTVALSSRIVKVLFWYGDCGLFCAFRLLKLMFCRFCPLSRRGDSNRTDLFCCLGLRSLESYLCPYRWRESSRLSCRLREGMYVFRLSRVSFSYLLLESSRESCWLLLSMELFLSRSLLRELSRDPLF